MSTQSAPTTPVGWSVTHTGCGEATFIRRKDGVHASIQESGSVMGGFRCIVEQASDGVRLVDEWAIPTLAAAVEQAETALGVSA